MKFLKMIVVYDTIVFPDHGKPCSGQLTTGMISDRKKEKQLYGKRLYSGNF